MSLKMRRFRGMTDRRELHRKLDEIIRLLKEANQKPPLAKRIMDGLGTGIGIASIVAIIDVIRGWIGG